LADDAILDSVFGQDDARILPALDVQGCSSIPVPFLTTGTVVPETPIPINQYIGTLRVLSTPGNNEFCYALQGSIGLLKFPA